MIEFRPANSFRDPAGCLLPVEGRLVRKIFPAAKDTYRRIFATSWFRELVESGDVINTWELEQENVPLALTDPTVSNLYVEHERVDFVSYPSEWPLEMLCAAARLTLNLCRSGIKLGIGLKDATPFNVLFSGARPVFVDVLSFEERNPHDHVWIAYSQFVQCFLLPALLDSRYAISCHSTFWTRREGLQPEEAYSLLSPISRLLPPFLNHVTMPVLLSCSSKKKKYDIYKSHLDSNAEKAAFILKSRLDRLDSAVSAAVKRKKMITKWADYSISCTYDDAHFGLKSTFVRTTLVEERPKRVLDVGCNTGHFSLLASSFGSKVVAIDNDPVVIGMLWQKAQEANADILPLVVNLAHPTPALGWINSETLSFLERATGQFETVMMLAVVHHLLVTEQIPLHEIVQVASKLSSHSLIIEYVGPGDQQFMRLTRGRDDLYSWYNRSVFEEALGRHFKIIRSQEIGSSGRWIYHARLWK